MQSILVESSEKEKRETYAKNLSKDFGIHTIDITTVEGKKSEKSTASQTKLGTIGIEDIRLLQEKLYLKPLQGEKKALIFQNFDTITTEAQNALLKILEEPPLHTIIILTISRVDLLLPTIRSRCQIVTLQEVLPKITGGERARILEDIQTIFSSGIAERLKLAQDVSKSKDESISWLEKMIIGVRTLILDRLLNDSNHFASKTSSDYLALLRSLQNTHTIIKTTNVNLRLSLENLFLSLP